MIFRDRHEAGQALAKRISVSDPNDAVVIALARGGVAVAREISSVLSLPLDVLVVKKIGTPGNSEFALGAIAPDDIAVVNWKLVSRLKVNKQYVRTRIAELEKEIEDKMHLYRKGRNPITVTGKTVILVDDGVATGATLEAAIRWCKVKHAGKIIVAVPVAHPSVVSKIKSEVDSFIAVDTPPELIAVGQFYEEFPQLTDENVIELLA